MLGAIWAFGEKLIELYCTCLYKLHIEKRNGKFSDILKFEKTIFRISVYQKKVHRRESFMIVFIAKKDLENIIYRSQQRVREECFRKVFKGKENKYKILQSKRRGKYTLRKVSGI